MQHPDQSMSGERQRKCEACGRAFSYTPIEFEGREVFTPRYCDTCLPTLQATQEQNAEARALRERWNELCPPLYQDTDLRRIEAGISPQIVRAVLDWRPQPKGLALVGRSGTGKTRLMFKLLEKLHMEGTPVKAVSAKQFERWCARMFEKDDSARKHIEACERTALLFIDDVGKERMTERVESELYALVESRTSHLKPILWTSNATKETLKTMLSADRGEPIVRRLEEFSKIYTT